MGFDSMGFDGRERAGVARCLAIGKSEILSLARVRKACRFSLDNVKCAECVLRCYARSSGIAWPLDGVNVLSCQLVAAGVPNRAPVSARVAKGALVSYRGRGRGSPILSVSKL